MFQPYAFDLDIYLFLFEYLTMNPRGFWEVGIKKFPHRSKCRDDSLNVVFLYPRILCKNFD